ncbi:MAG: ABC transporter permease subunit [Gammaproteobacteria bacterium]|nr:ABC transporter permease subunit [Gammaproteobacteria bacterium]MDH5593076.1 ABC transporter permease subunit [Gammaproteobacteria bacterium]
MIVFNIAMRELRSMFLSPLAWSILGVVQFILGYMFLTQIDSFMMVQPRLAGMEGAPGITDIIVAPLLGNAAIVLLLIVPLITMRLVSDERRSQTLSLLLSAPVSMTEIVIGKYLGICAFLTIILAMIALMPLSLLVGGDLDFGKLLSCLLGLGLLLGGFGAIGLFMSTLTAQPTVAAVSTFGVLLLLWIVDWAASGGEGSTYTVISYISLLRHYEPLLKGVFNSTDIIYYILFVITFLVFSIRRLDSERLQH